MWVLLFGFHVYMYIYTVVVNLLISIITFVHVTVHRREQKSCEFNLYEAYAIDLIVSTGEGRTKPHDTRSTVFRKTEDLYQLKMKASRGGAMFVTSTRNNVLFLLILYPFISHSNIYLCTFALS